MEEEQTIELRHEWSADQWDWPLQGHDGLVRVTNTKDKFEVGLDVKFFAPNEIEIKCQAHELWIHCRHEPRDDEHGNVSRELHRAYRLPADVDTNTLRSHLRKNGTLIIEAKKSQPDS